jgi:hypothetical protein
LMIKKLSTDGQLTPPDGASQYDAPAASARSMSLATLPLVAMGQLI